MLKDRTQVNVPNEIIAQLNTLKKLEMDTVIALWGEINQNVAKLQIAKKDNDNYYQDNVSVDFELRNSELKKDINSNTKKNLIDILIDLSDMLYPIELEKVNNTTVKVKYSCSIKDKEIGKMYDEGEYTKINLANLSALTGKYDKLLYILMFKHSNVGLIHMNMDTLADLFNSNVSQMRVLKSRINKAINNISALLDNDKVQLVNSLTWETENITGHDRVKGINLSFNKIALNNKISNDNKNKKENKVTETRSMVNNDEKDKENALLKAQVIRQKRQLEELTKLVSNVLPEYGPSEEKLDIIPLTEKRSLDLDLEKSQEEYDKLSTWEKLQQQRDFENFDFSDFNDSMEEHQKELDESAEQAKKALAATKNRIENPFDELIEEEQQKEEQSTEQAKVTLPTNDDDGFHCFDAEFGNTSVDDVPF